MKTLKQILELYEPDTKDGKAFVQKHAVVKTTDANGNGDEVFKAANVKPVDRKKERHGHESGPEGDESVYEDVKMFGEMNKSMAYAIAEKATGDQPPLEKSTIKKAHHIAKKILAKEEFESFLKENVEQVSDEEIELLNSIYKELDEEDAETFVSVVESGELDQFLEDLDKALEEEQSNG
jgi:hypothetical protein